MCALLLFDHFLPPTSSSLYMPSHTAALSFFSAVCRKTPATEFIRLQTTNIWEFCRMLSWKQWFLSHQRFKCQNNSHWYVTNALGIQSVGKKKNEKVGTSLNMWKLTDRRQGDTGSSNINLEYITGISFSPAVYMFWTSCKVHLLTSMVRFSAKKLVSEKCGKQWWQRPSKQQTSYKGSWSGRQTLTLSDRLEAS